MAAIADALPRDAATLVIVESSGPAPRILLGKRRQTQVFAPGKYVFPGGSLDAADCDLTTGQQLLEHDRMALAHEPGPASAQVTPEAFAYAAIRETFEETGLVFGSASHPALTNPPAAWVSFFALGVGPNLGALSFIARAITPPGRPRRFDARFFLADAAAISHRLPGNDGEFDDLIWVDFSGARGLDMHGMTRQIVEETERFLALSPAERRLSPVPFYFQAASGWQRSHIDRLQIARKP